MRLHFLFFFRNNDAQKAMAQDAIAVTPEIQFILNSFMFLICGALVMWMAAGFAMLESGLVRSKNTSAICLKMLFSTLLPD